MSIKGKVAMLLSAGKHIGTAWLINTTHALTAAHSVRTADGQMIFPDLTLKFYNLKSVPVEVYNPSTDLILDWDVAILTLKVQEQALADRVIYLSRWPFQRGDQCYMHGYPHADSRYNPDGFSVNGTVINPAHRYHFTSNPVEVIQLAYTSSWEDLSGISGSPIFYNRTGEEDFAVGTVSGHRENDKFNIYGISIHKIARLSSILSEALLESPQKRFEIPDNYLLHLGKGVPGEEEAGDKITDFDDTWEEEYASWEIQYKNVKTQYPNIDTNNNQSIILSAVNDIGKLVYATRAMGFGKRKEIPNLLRILNDLLWPQMLSSWENDLLLSDYDFILTTCFVYTNLALKNRASIISLKDVDKAYNFLMANINANRIQHNVDTYKLFSLVTWLNHRFMQFDKVIELTNFSQKILIDKRYPSHEEQILFLSLARLYINATKYYDSEIKYCGELSKLFYYALSIIEDEFWKKSLALLAMLYEKSSASTWSDSRENFIKIFEKIDFTQITVANKAAVYMELYARYLEIKDIISFQAYEHKIDCLTELIQQIKLDHAWLDTYKLFLLIGACFSCPWDRVVGLFLKVENMMFKESSKLGPIWGPIVKARLLNLFIFRIYDQRILRQDTFTHNSKIVSHLLDKNEIKSLNHYFGISQFKIDYLGNKTEEAFWQLKSTVRLLVQEGLFLYATVILPNNSLDPGARARATLDYMDFLTNANTRYSNIRVSAVFRDMVKFLENYAYKTPIFHYYLARLYYKHYMRDVPNALKHYNQFWKEANDFQKNRFAAEYARALYEYHIYFEREKGKDETLDALLQIGREFLRTGSKRHFISCFYGLGLILKDSKDDDDAKNESDFLFNLYSMLNDVMGNINKNEVNYYDKLIGNIVGSTIFYEFLEKSQCNIANALLSSLNSPEVYNDIATYLLNIARKNFKKNELTSIKILYDIAIGLSKGQGYYQPKFEFNRTRCDFIEIESKGAPHQKDLNHLISIIDSLHKLGPKFPWARKFINKEVCQYLFLHRENIIVKQLMNLDRFNRYWKILKKAIDNKLQIN